MPEKTTDFIDIILKAGPAIGLALAGAFAELMISLKTIDVRFVLGSFAAAGFTGLMMHFLLYDLDLPESIKAFLIGMSGASGRTSMTLLKQRSNRILAKVLTDGNDNDNDKSS